MRSYKKLHFLKTLFLFLLVFSLCILIPAGITLIMHSHSDGNKDPGQPLVSSGKYVILGEGDSEKRMDAEAFIPCAVMGSVKDSEYLNQPEFLKAFSIVLRTIIYQRLNGSDSVSVKELRIPYLTPEQLQKTWKKNFSKNYALLQQAAKDSFPSVLTYEEALIFPRFHLLNNGSTRAGSMPYETAVACPEDPSHPDFVKTTVCAPEVFVKKIKELLPELSIPETTPLESFQIVSKDDAGYVTCLQIGGTEIPVDDFVKTMEISSPCFDVDEYQKGIRILSKGKGCGFGMSLYSACKLASNGKNASEILALFYPGCQISLLSN